MNPYQTIIASAYGDKPPTNVEQAGLHAVLSLLSDAYSSGYTSGTNRYHYAVGAIRSRFGESHPMTVLARSTFANK